MNMLILFSSKPTFKLFESKLIFLSNKWPQLKLIRLFRTIKSMIKKTPAPQKLINLSTSLSDLYTASRYIKA